MRARRLDPIAVPPGTGGPANRDPPAVLGRRGGSQTRLDAQAAIVRGALLVREGLTITPEVASERARNIVQQLQALEVE